MEKEFWINAWEERRIGFHMPKPSPALVNLSKDYFLKESTVLVPLCGKSIDLLWLKEQGHQVIGVEIAPKAIAEFFRESNLEFTKVQRGPFTAYTSDNLTILEGSFFDLDKIDIGEIHCIWDRASIVALPEHLRKIYTTTIKKVSNPNTKILLASLEQTDVKDFGPPFHVGKDEVNQSYQDSFSSIKIVDQKENKAEGRFKEAGIKKMKRVFYKISN